MNQVQNISFHGQTVPVFTKNNQHYVAMKPICENIGLDWVSQHKKIQRNTILHSGMVMMTIPATDGKSYETTCLPIEYLNGWLFGVDAKRVKPEIRERLLTYQRECFRVLNAHFNPPAQKPAAPAAKPAPPLPSREDLMQLIFVYETRMAEVHGWQHRHQQTDWYERKFCKQPAQATYDELAYIINMMHINTSTANGRPILPTIPLPQATDTLKWLIHYNLAAASLLNHTANAVLRLNPQKAVQMQRAANACATHAEMVQEEYGISQAENTLYTVINWDNPPKQVQQDLDKLLIN